MVFCMYVLVFICFCYPPCCSLSLLLFAVSNVRLWLLALWNETGPEAGAATSTAEHKMTKMTAATEAKSTDWTSLVTITSTVRLTAVTASPDPTVKSSCTTTDLATSVPEVFPDPATSATQSSAPDKASVNGTRKATNASIPIGAGSCAGIIILIMLAVVGAVTLKRRRGQRSAEMPELQKEQVSLTHAEPLPSHDREQYTTVAEHDQ
ncbi:hypothetical protein MATL_G00249990 [Megalops atlanticus]|uniref:Uncharacterized protein n=1 Tax=Megalops atlanticus TaxID=7932 RepID=A0A9D3SVA9_MEGAT|nr:hypothetical protein MATL_G00249990 [Megalops atlanticus]